MKFTFQVDASSFGERGCSPARQLFKHARMLSEWLVSLSDKVISVRSKLCRATGTIGGGKVVFKIAGGKRRL